MLFSSTLFIYFFLPIVLLIYYGLLRKNRSLQNIFLTLASLVFYAWDRPKFVLVMIFSIFVNWFLGLQVAKYQNAQNIFMKKVVIFCTMVINLLILFIFKYLTFSLSIIDQIFQFNMPIPQITLPIGISFFTFQAMSYVLDISCNKGTAQKNIMNVGLYITLFPQLIAGPIVRYETVSKEILHRKETFDDFFDGFSRFVVGLSKKVLLSNNLSIFVDNTFASVGNISVASSWLGAICYTLQIFFDFSGYSDMAIGLGKMFGFHFLENFDYPYISKSITEFWRRWHISLGTWFRDYVYIPLGGSRVKTPRLILNLFVVWSLTGIWHGANWTFIVWGLMYFILLTFEKISGFTKSKPSKPSVFFRWLYTLFFVILGWVIFRADSLSIAWIYIKTMIGMQNCVLFDNIFFENLRQSGIVLCFSIILSLPITRWFKTKIDTNHAILKISYNLLLVVLFILSISSIVSSTHNPFIYFNF